MKNANGTGSVRKRSDGRWEARYTAPDGVQRSVYGRTKQAAIEALKRVQAHMTLGTYVEPSRMTVAQWAEVWLRDYTPHIRENTRTNYTLMLRKHILPALGGKKLSSLKRLHVQGYINGLQYAPGTIRVQKAILSAMLECAVKLEIIQTNPAKNISLPQKHEQVMHIVDRDKFKAFFDEAEKHEEGNAYKFLLLTGLRIGELSGLKWADVCGNTLTVSRQMYRDGTLHETKSGKSRNIVLTEEAMRILQEQRIQQAETRPAMGWKDTPQAQDLIFRRADGSPCIHHYFDSIRGIGQAIGISGLHPHDLRHSYAVAALRAGIDIKTVQNNLGHSSAAMTLDVYAKYTTDMGMEAAEKFAEYVKKSLG